MTATRSEMYRTTDRSWATNRYDSPSSALSSFSRLITPARIETSSAETGSSSTTSDGLVASARAMRDPLPLAAGERGREAVAVVRVESDQFHQILDPPGDRGAVGQAEGA